MVINNSLIIQWTDNQSFEETVINSGTKQTLQYTWPISFSTVNYTYTGIANAQGCVLSTSNRQFTEVEFHVFNCSSSNRNFSRVQIIAIGY